MRRRPAGVYLTAGLPPVTRRRSCPAYNSPHNGGRRTSVPCFRKFFGSRLAGAAAHPFRWLPLAAASNFLLTIIVRIWRKSASFGTDRDPARCDAKANGLARGDCCRGGVV